MCYFYHPTPINMVALKDLKRGRHDQTNEASARWYALERYVLKRWRECRDPYYYSKWCAILMSIKARRPW